MKDNKYPPIDPQNVIDLVFASTFFTTSSSKEGQKLGQYFLIDYLHELKQKYKDDVEATLYIQAIEPIVGSALRAFNVEKLNYKRKILPLENIQKEEELAIKNDINILPFYSSSKVFGKWTLLLTNLVFGLIGGASAISLKFKSKELILLIIGIVGASLAILISNIIIRVIKYKLTKKTINRINVDLDKYWSNSYNKYETTLFDTLVSCIRIKEQYYPHLFTFEDGHLFPRKNFPFLFPVNYKELSPSERNSKDLINELLEIVRARISIRPDTNKLEWLLKKVENENE
jgi:hypothetical protein